MTQVLVVDRSAFFGGDWPQGFRAMHGDEASTFLDRAWAAGRFEERVAAERNPAWKQWIPYCVLRCHRQGGARPNPLEEGIFQVRRSSGQTESRLHGSWSIGLGGHVEPEDRDPHRATGPERFGAALARELHEELDLRGCPAPAARFLGLLNDDGTEVGEVHAGLVYAWDLNLPLTEARAAVKIREISKMSGGFGSLVELRRLWQDHRSFESWSRILILAGIAGPMGDSR